MRTKLRQKDQKGDKETKNYEGRIGIEINIKVKK